MKKLLLIILTFFSVHSALAQADQQWLQKKLSISMQQVPIEEVLKQLEKKMDGVAFAYSPSTFDLKQPVTIKAKDKTLQEILNTLFKGESLEAREMRGKIFLMRKKTVGAGKQTATTVRKRRSLSHKTAVTPTAKDTVLSKTSRQTEAKTKTTENELSKTAEKSQNYENTSVATSKADKSEQELPAAATTPLVQQSTPQEVVEIPEAKRTFRRPVRRIESSDTRGEEIYEYSQTLLSRPVLPPIPQDTSLIKTKVPKKVKMEGAKVKKEKKEKAPRVPEEKKFRLYVGATGSLTQINGDLGVKLGGRLVWLKSSRFGIGLSGSALAGQLVNDEVLNGSYRLAGGYGGLFLEYNVQPHKRVHLSFPVTFALGAITYMRSNTAVQPLDFIEDERVVGIVEPGVLLEVNVWKFVKIGAEVNYRYATFSELNYSTTGDVILSGSGLSGFSGGLTLKLGIF